MHTTNYYNTFIEVAGDCPTNFGEVPMERSGSRSIALIQFELVSKNPYQYTSDEILMMTFIEHNDLEEHDMAGFSARFFAKGKACLRSSPLAKRYGWGIHCNESGRIAIYGAETAEYKKLSHDPGLKILKAMRSQKAK